MNVLDQAAGERWKMYLGDSCEVLKGLPDRSVDLCIHSPPFSNLYIYSDSEADLGNSVDDDEFMQHYEFIISELFRVSVIGRICVVHCKDLPKYANRDGTAGLKDFPGAIIAAYERHGWSYHSRVTIWKCPVVERERTNNNGLLHKTVIRDRSQLRQGMADYLLVFRRPPEGTLMSEKPIAVDEGFEMYCGPNAFDPRESDDHPSPFSRGRGKRTGKQHDLQSSIDIWRRYAEPVWWDIDQMDVLNYKTSRGDKDERHICPLQLGIIERCVHIWSLPDEIVLSPFAGIGSEGVGALKLGRKFLGIELKREYFNKAILELESVSEESDEQMSLFDVRKHCEFGGIAGPVAEVVE